MTKKQIDEIDKNEYKLKGNEREPFICQNVKKCIEISDIHLNNPQEDEFDTSRFKKQLAWYLALIIHPGLVTPTKIERCMQIAYSAKLNSGCISRQVGAVVTDKNYSIKAVGWNAPPSGQVPCLLRSVEAWKTYEDKQAFSDYENKNTDFRELMKKEYKKFNKKDCDLKGRNSSFCFKDAQNRLCGDKNQVHTRSLHAEENAFLQISKYGGEGVQGGILFTTASPCESCAKKAYQLGIRKIIYIDPYPGIANTHILQSGQIKPELELFHGAIGRAYHQLYQPILPFKDELDILINSKKNYLPENDLQDLQELIENLEEAIKSDYNLKEDDKNLALKKVDIWKKWQNKAEFKNAMFALKGMAYYLPLADNSDRACKELLDKIEEEINDSK